MIDYTEILTCKFPGEQWTLNGDDYDGLTWLSDSDKPTKAKLDGFWKEVQAAIKAENDAKLQTKNDLLTRLGLTEEEFKLLLA